MKAITLHYIDGMQDDPQAPWGGFNFSGLVREFGAFGIEALLERAQFWSS